MNRLHDDEADDESILRLSLDAKATIKLGPFSRHGRSRVPIEAADHDFQPEGKLTPLGIYLPTVNELYLYLLRSKVTSDSIVDALEACWQTIRHRFPKVKTLLINADNGPEMHSRRTQLMQRLTTFADREQLTIQLAYYPPYHSKYNPIERVWGGLEQHWNGSLLDSVAATLALARSFTWRARQPLVSLVEHVYYSGVKLSQQAMSRLEERFDRLDGLEKWFLTIAPRPL